MKIALVHDYLSQNGGAERVLQVLHEIWPQAPIFVLFHDKEKITEFSEAEIRESFFRKFPGARKHYQWYLPLMPYATEQHDLREFDVVISSTSAFAKGVLTHPDAIHISYCHTPTRYLWSDSHRYINDLKRNPAIKALLPPLMHRLRQWDKLSVDRVDHFIANSKTVQERIQKYYRRNSVIIYPPINIHDFQISPVIEDYYITGGRIVTYKKFDLLVETFNRLQKPLIIFGEGPHKKALEKRAKSNIRFMGRVSEQQKIALLSRARAFIHPQVEDCGITPLESMASGRPVIAYAKGGATETVVEGLTGTFFHEQTWESLFETMRKFDHEIWNPRRIRTHAHKFDATLFKQRITSFVEQHYHAKQKV